MTTANQRPNIVFILADDLGWADLGVYGQTHFATPHLDALAREGIRFTDGYANSAVCSATRFALITGRYQYRLRGGLEEPMHGPRAAQWGLPPEHPTLPSLLRDAGYRTGLVGKWHLGSPPAFGPLQSGYESFFGNHGGAIDYFTHKPGVGDAVPADLYEGTQPVAREGYYTDILADEACRYIDADDARPFLLSLHFTAPHWPWEGPDDAAVSGELSDLRHYDGGSLETYGKIVTALDAAIGRVIARLKQKGLYDNTLIVFTSDNGGERFSKTWPFIGRKSELLEGGIRVPTIATWPNRLQPAVSEQVVVSMDWLPTLLAAAGAAPDPRFPPDGLNVLPILEGQSPVCERRLFWRYKANAQQAMRDGKWKYLKLRDNTFLFDLSVDGMERANLKHKHPEQFASMQRLWEEWNEGMLPITDDVGSYGASGVVLADRYTPEPRPVSLD